MEIRQLPVEDAAIYRELRLRALREDPEAFGETYEEALANPLARTEERLRAQAAPDGSFTLGAFQDGLVGAVTLLREVRVKMRHRAVIVGMYVTPEVRGRGVGRALLSAACARAATLNGLAQLHLAVVMPNAPARQLYRSMGFVPYGVEPRALNVGDRYWDEELMMLALHPA